MQRLLKKTHTHTHSFFSCIRADKWKTNSFGLSFCLVLFSYSLLVSMSFVIACLMFWLFRFSRTVLLYVGCNPSLSSFFFPPKILENIEKSFFFSMVCWWLCMYVCHCFLFSEFFFLFSCDLLCVLMKRKIERMHIHLPFMLYL
jgi:hypothetical protein